MMTIVECVLDEHDGWLVLLAALLCVTGSWVTARLFQRMASTDGAQRYGWLFMTALAAGVGIWCTHFIGMLGYDAGVPVGFDLAMTVVSLLVSVIGSTIGFIVAASRLARFTPALGGAIVGLAIAAMHYTGMMAYRVQGIVSWNPTYLIVSIVLSVGLSAVALHLAMRPGPRSTNFMAGVLALAIVMLHFTGMTAFRVEPLLVDGSFSNPAAFQALAFAVAAMSFVIVGAGAVSYMIDDSARAASMEKLRRLALSDTLTGLPNRASFNERLNAEMALARENNGRLVLVGIDLNRFKEVNDLRGHSAGDEVLRILGRRIRELLHEEASEFVARTGGDEFSGLYRMHDVHALSDFLARLEAALFKPIHFDGAEIVPGASFGVAIFPDDAADAENLVNHADLAMYRAKADPLRNVCFYEAGMDEKIRARRTLAADLRQALERHEFSLHYQVQTAVSTGDILGYEVLLRWEHPQFGPIGPDEFIPLAEENGLILPIGEWVLRTACAEAATWAEPYKVAVNLSAVQFIRADLPRVIMETLIETGLAPERLELELTESAIFADRERALLMLRQIKNLGVSIALDDFGTGYSSLETLRAFPFDRIKIDRSFFTMAADHPQTIAIVRAVLALGKTFGIPVLAEGIETEDQLSMLNAEGCEEAQGFLLGRPAPLVEIIGRGELTLNAGRDGDDAGPALKVAGAGN
ncbi:putative bifunctional diguanylate cyclase/phosphodiesterase [Shinella daejeonensis]|uniref:putative bifunctional diguanylate cyclase/phosphodiesterase n=1 Tax=Shinella daejeonensis TaxID=659017 RepID=UPI0020C81C9F|nr:bifunctional diguanylate cyclase/phosphodiesterase [Shinella daejeonensis]